MLEVRVTEDRIFIGERFSVSFQRTLRVPESYRASKLPPGFGPLPVQRVADYADRVPATWKPDAVMIPLDAREAMWLSFNAASWKPNAVKVGVGEINAISGEAWSSTLSDDPQNYVVCPLQLWLDGINAGENFVRQFVAVPLGQGYTVESQVNRGVETGGLRIMVFEPKPGLFPDQAPANSPLAGVMRSFSPGEFGVGAGARIEQRIYPDPYGVETWDSTAMSEVFVYLVSRERFREITGREAPRSPIGAREYTEYGLGPWFELMDKSLGDIAAPENLSQLQSVNQRDVEEGRAAPDEETEFEVDPTKVKRIRHHAEKDDSNESS